MLVANPNANPNPIAKYKTLLGDGKKETIDMNMINIPTILIEPTLISFSNGIQRLNFRPNKQANTKTIIKSSGFISKDNFYSP